MFRFIKQIFISAMMFFGSLSRVNLLECILIKMKNCKVRPEIININGNNSIFFSFSIKVNKCSDNCNNINDPYARICVPDAFKNLNVKVFNIISRTNETRHIKWHETCKCICRLDGIICNSKQRWNEDKCRCECKELINKGVCDKGYIWSPSNCECECDKSCDIGEYLDYSNCKCRKKLYDKLIDECTENTDVVMIDDENKNKCSFSIVYIVCIVLFSIILSISIRTGIYFVYYHWYLKKYGTHSVFNTRKETLIY